MTPKLRLAAALAAGALLLAACGDDPTIPDPGEVAEEIEGTVEDAMEAAGDAAADAIPPVATVDNNFAPSALAAPGNQEITIEVRNNGQNPHSFTIDDVVDTGVLQSGETAEATFTTPDGGELQYYCTVHGADVMSGTLTVI